MVVTRCVGVVPLDPLLDRYLRWFAVPSGHALGLSYYV